MQPDTYRMMIKLKHNTDLKAEYNVESIILLEKELTRNNISYNVYYSTDGLFYFTVGEISLFPVMSNCGFNIYNKRVRLKSTADVDYVIKFIQNHV